MKSAYDSGCYVVCSGDCKVKSVGECSYGVWSEVSVLILYGTGLCYYVYDAAGSVYGVEGWIGESGCLYEDDVYVRSSAGCGSVGVCVSSDGSSVSS